MLFYINKNKKILVGRNNQISTVALNIDFHTTGYLSFAFIDDQNKILPIDETQTYYFAGKKNEELFLSKTYKIEQNVITFAVNTYTVAFLGIITKRNTEIEIELGTINGDEQSVLLSDYAFAQPRVYIEGFNPETQVETDPIYTADKPNIALKSEIPTKLSQLDNDEGFISGYTETDPIYTADKPNIALKSEIPTKLSQLDNDEGYIKTYTETDPIYTADKPNIALKSELFSGSYNDLTNKPEIFEPTTTGDGTKFLSDNGAYLAAGGADYEITYYNATATTTFSFTESAHYFPNATSDETDCVFTFTIEDGAITNGGFSFVLKATGTNSNTFTLTDETSKGINWATDIPAELEYGKWYILAVENFTGIFCELK